MIGHERDILEKLSCSEEGFGEVNHFVQHMVVFKNITTWV